MLENYEFVRHVENLQTVGPNQWSGRCFHHDDSENSLHLSLGDGGRLLVDCKAGCSTIDMLQAVGLKFSDLYPESDSGRSRKKELGPIVATYDYCSPTGELLFQVTRHHPKTFRQRKPNGKGGWINSVSDTERVPYRLPEILASTGLVVIVEGEKDADNLRSTGITATTNAGGAGKWLESYAQFFRGRDVAIIPDKDKPNKKGIRPGETHGQDVARKLYESAASIKVIELPGESKDVSDWLAAGGTADQLRKIIESTPAWQFETPKPLEAPDDPHRLARICISEFLRIYQWRDEWYVRSDDNTHYRKLSSTELRARVNAACKREFDRLNIASQLDGGKPETCSKVTTSLVSNVEAAMRSVCILPNEIELGSWIAEDKHNGRQNWIALRNGIVRIDDLISGGITDVHPHSPDWFSTICLPYEYAWDAECPKWNAYLKTSLDDDEQRTALLREWAGYLLTPCTDQQKFLILEGEGKNGKSVYLAAIEAMLGEENCSHVPLEIFGQRFQLTPTLGKLANIAADCGEVDHVAEGYLKSFTSGDRMSFDRKGIAPVEASPTARLMIATNNRPRFSDKSQGLWRRMLLVPFDVEIPEANRVVGMDKVDWWQRSGELSGIFNWAVYGLAMLRANGGFSIPDVCREAVERYRDETNPARQFLTENYERDQHCSTPTADVYQSYKSWCEANGYRPLGERMLGKEVAREFHGIERKRGTSTNGRFWYYDQLGVKSSMNLFSS